MHNFKLPLVKGKDGALCGYGRWSDAYVDADGAPVLIIDPSEGEYAACCTEEQAAQLILCANAHDDLVSALEGLLESAWDGDPRRQIDDPLCIAARAALYKAKQ